MADRLVISNVDLGGPGPYGITFVGQAGISGASVDYGAVPLADQDLLVLVSQKAQDGSSNMTVPVGWETIEYIDGFQAYWYIAWRRWSTGDPTTVTPVNAVYATVLAYRGVHPTDPIVGSVTRGEGGTGSVGVEDRKSLAIDLAFNESLSTFTYNQPGTMRRNDVSGGFGGAIADTVGGTLSFVNGQQPMAIWTTSGGGSLDAIGTNTFGMVILRADWTLSYPASTLPWFADFPSSPEFQGSLQYRDADTGELLALRPIAETPDFVEGGYRGDRLGGDYVYGPAAGAVNSENIYVCGWNTASISKLDASTAATVWRINGYQNGQPTPPYCSSSPYPLLSEDGTKLYVDNNCGSFGFVALDTSDGSFVETIPVVGSIRPNRGVLRAPNGTFIFGWNGGTAPEHGIYRLDPATGAVTPVLLLPSLGLSYNTTGTGANYLYCWQMAAHPGGEGFVFTLTRYNGTYHSELIECDWNGNVLNTYSYLASGLDDNRLLMMFAVCYSSDGQYLYATTDQSYSIIWRFERGPGNVGGAWPWMHLDFATKADWEAVGAPYNYGQVDEVMWDSVVAGVARYAVECVPPANDNWANAEVLPDDYFQTFFGDLCGATEEVGEQGPPAKTVWYSWTAPAADHVVQMGLYGGAITFLPRFRVYTGASVGALTSVGVVTETSVTPPDQDVTALVLWDAQPGTTYWFQIGLDADYIGAPDAGAGPFEMALQDGVHYPPGCVPPPNDNWADAEALVGDSGSVTGTTVCATLEDDEPSLVC